MEASERCILAIQGWEGCKLQVYPDANGYPTIGYGHKLTHDDLVNKLYLNGIVQVRADVLFGLDLSIHETDVDSLKLTLKQGQYDALVSFDYNLGIDALNMMLSHGLDQVPVQLPRWVHVGGKVLPGLEFRRAVEVQWWNE